MSSPKANFVKAMLVASSSAIALLATPAAAQEQPAAAITPAAPDTGDEIIVTAQKRAQRLQDVPISVAVVSGDAIRESSFKNFQDFSNYVPNLNISKTPGADQIILRGIGSGAGSPSLDQSVAMFVDGIYGGHSRQFTAPFLDIERVEVLRGPQGALVGKNTSAGAINIITKRPGHELEGYVLGEYDFDLKAPKIEAAATLPLSPDFSIRAVGKYTDADGWVRNSLSGNKEPARAEKVGRLTAAYDSGDFNATLKAEASRVQVDGNPFVIYSPIAGRFRDHSKETASRYGTEFDNVDAQAVVLNLSYKLGDYSLESITGYSAYQSAQGEDADFFEKDLAYATFDEDYHQTSQELRILSPSGGQFEWGAGAYFQADHLEEERTTSVTTAANANTYRQFLQKDRVYSVYGQATFRATEQFWLLGSLRYTYQKKDGQYRSYTGNDVINQKSNGTTLTRTIIDSFGDGQVDPSVSLQYRPSDNLMFYASYLHGSKSGGFQGAISNALAASFQFEPETSQSFEGGLKATFPGYGYVNVAVFDTKYKNLQLSQAIQTTSTTSFSFFTGNAGDAKVRGVELDGQLRFGGNFTVDTGIAFTPTRKFGSYAAGPCYTGRTPTNVAQGSCDLSGQTLGYVPKWTLNLTPRAHFELSDSLKLTSSVTLLHKSTYLNDLSGDPLSVQKAFTKFDARIAIGAVDDKWELALIGRNLTDKTTISYSGAASLASNPAIGLARDARQQGIDLPRTVAVQGTVRF